MREITGEGLLQELDRARLTLRSDAAEPAVAFDADGTLWTGDVGDEFFESLVAAGAVRPEAAERFANEVASLAPASPSIKHGAEALTKAVSEHRFDEERFYEMVGWLGAGHTRSELESFADAMHRERDLDARLHAEVKPVLAWARANGVEVFVVSASPCIVVARGVARLGIDAAHVLGAESDFEGERMAARPRRPIPYGPGKVTALRSKIGDRPLLAAFGDNVFDIDMLQRATVAVAIRPKPRLTARAGEVRGLFRLLP